MSVVRFFLSSFCSISTFLTFTTSAFAADFFAAPGGSVGGQGSLSSPWDIFTALNSSTIRPGDTLYLRGGVYTVRDMYTPFRCRLTGTASAPITLRPYNNERAILDGGLEVLSGGVVIRDLEVTRYMAHRRSAMAGPFPTDVNAISGISVYGPDVKVINNTVHDAADGLSSFRAAPNTELYGNIVYYNGWRGPDRGHGHGLYSQNSTGFKLVEDNIFFDHFAQGVQVYGTSTSELKNFYLEGNITFNNGSLQGEFSRNILLGGTAVLQDSVAVKNLSYFPLNTQTGDNNLGYYNSGAGCTNLRFEDNYLSNGGIALSLHSSCQFSSFRTNTIVGQLRNFEARTYPNNTYSSTSPGGQRIFVRANRYERGRGHVSAFNWSRANTITADLSSLGLRLGETYEIKNVQNLFVESLTRTYDGQPVSIPMTGWTKAMPYGTGWVTPASTFPEFGVFLIKAKTDGAPPAPTASPTPSPTATAAPTASPTSTPRPTSTPAFTPTAAPTSTPLPTPPPIVLTPTPRATSTPLPSPTQTRLPTPTSTPMATSTPVARSTTIPVSGSYRITPSKVTFLPREELRFSWEKPKEAPAAWVGLYLKGAADRDYYGRINLGAGLTGATSALLPARTGEFELRMFKENSFLFRMTTSSTVQVAVAPTSSKSALLKSKTNRKVDKKKKAKKKKRPVKKSNPRR